MLLANSTLTPEVRQFCSLIRKQLQNHPEFRAGIIWWEQKGGREFCQGFIKLLLEKATCQELLELIGSNNRLHAAHLLKTLIYLRAKNIASQQLVLNAIVALEKLGIEPSSSSCDMARTRLWGKNPKPCYFFP